MIDPDGPDHRETAAQLLDLLLAAGVPGPACDSEAGTVHATRAGLPDGSSDR